MTDRECYFRGFFAGAWTYPRWWNIYLHLSVPRYLPPCILFCFFSTGPTPPWSKEVFLAWRADPYADIKSSCHQTEGELIPGTICYCTDPSILPASPIPTLSAEGKLPGLGSLSTLGLRSTVTRLGFTVIASYMPRNGHRVVEAARISVQRTRFLDELLDGSSQAKTKRPAQPPARDLLPAAEQVTGQQQRKDSDDRFDDRFAFDWGRHSSAAPLPLGRFLARCGGHFFSLRGI